MKARPKILIVDDHSEFGAVLSEVLGAEGFECDYVANGQEALDHLQTGHPDLILLDWQMRVMDGRGFLQRRMAARPLAKIPVIVLSAAANIDRAVAHFRVSVFQKPIDLEALLIAIRKLID